MSDRTAAECFGYAFETCLMITPSSLRVAQAKRLWKLGGCFDFSWEQMDCDDTLVALGLACKGVDPNYPADGVVTIYYKFGKEL